MSGRKKKALEQDADEPKTKVPRFKVIMSIIDLLCDFKNMMCDPYKMKFKLLRKYMPTAAAVLLFEPELVR